MTAILDAASEAFSLMGVRNATMGEIADRAGMARANLYYNFASKEEMAAALAERLPGERLCGSATSQGA
ncbi:helix-turn-helix domain-containing protein [Rhizorhabdus dicambivorans]|uniref:helix-turn-helix domain-containing protein n=1 Tax=Rhizorhabdus dicambivorans TaxID=1850238 RepID=UPI00129031EF|nr:helix-turn-helix domain-containing protein [Rhizorhabdus dicambivorans]